MPDEPTALLRSLEAFTAAHPTGRKILVGPTLLWGRELLRALARTTGGWIGWEPTTIRSLADDLALVALSEARTRVASDVEIGALVGAALDEAVAQREVPLQWEALTVNAGFRRAVRDGVLQLRMSGTTPDALRQLQAAGTVNGVTAVLERFSALLVAHCLADPAAVISASLESFAQEAPFTLDAAILLAPGLVTRGLPGQLLHLLVQHGAVVAGWAALDGYAPPLQTLEAIAQAGNAPMIATPSSRTFVARKMVEMFVAATPADEVREAVRRAIGEGYRLDEIELTSSDVDTYGVALDALSRHLGFASTLQEGLPYQRSRIGRAVARHLDWMEQGLPADLLREALEAGDIVAPAGRCESAILARALRSLRIGWSRDRYVTALNVLGSGVWAASEGKRFRDRDDGTESDASAEIDRIAGELSALLARLLSTLPVPTDQDSKHADWTTPQAIAASLIQLLDLVPVEDPADQFNARRLRERLGELAGVAEAAGPFGAAVGAVRETLTDFRVWPQVSGGGSPRLSHAGAVHLSDFQHAGVTGRPRVFVLGLDSDRATGPRIPDPLLSDSVREALTDLATTADRRAEFRWRASCAVASHEGRVSLSFASQNSMGGTAGPAPLLLDVARQLWNDRALDFSKLRTALGAPACAVPTDDAKPLDGRDVWLGAIGSGGALLDGEAVVRAQYPGLDAGVRAVQSLAAPAVTPYQGLVSAAAGMFDPTQTGARAVSATALELLSKCPLSWFYKYGLRLRPLDDPEYDPDAWLDPLKRGSVLHEVLETFVEQYRGGQDGIKSVKALNELLTICDAVLAWQRDTSPPPSEGIFLAERDDIHRAARSFLAMERGLLGHASTPTWEAVEFELEGDDGVVALPDGRRFRLRGFIDRIDMLPSGGRLIVDYKTGNPRSYRKTGKDGPLNGGRQLQPALYSAAFTAVSGNQVERFEFRFPTAKGGNQIVRYLATELGAGINIVQGVLEPLQSGAFLPTLNDSDCKFCDHASICRVKGDEEARERTVSPRAIWAKELGVADARYRSMQERRKP